MNVLYITVPKEPATPGQNLFIQFLFIILIQGGTIHFRSSNLRPPIHGPLSLRKFPHRSTRTLNECEIFLRKSIPIMNSMLMQSFKNLVFRRQNKGVRGTNKRDSESQPRQSIFGVAGDIPRAFVATLASPTVAKLLAKVRLLQCGTVWTTAVEAAVAAIPPGHAPYPHVPMTSLEKLETHDSRTTLQRN